MNKCIHYSLFRLHTGWPKKTNTETNQNDTDTNDILGTNFILCKDIK